MGIRRNSDVLRMNAKSGWPSGHRRWETRFQLSLLMIGMVSLSACARLGLASPQGALKILDRVGPAQGFLRGAAILGGIIILLVGGRIYRNIVAVPGFVVGAILGASIANSIDAQVIYIVVGVVLGGLLGAALALALHYLAVFIIGAFGGASIAASLWAIFSDSTIPLFLTLVGGAVGGGLLLALSNVWMVLVTAALGAMMIQWGTQSSLGIGFILFMTGILFQYALTRFADRSTNDRADS